MAAKFDTERDPKPGEIVLITPRGSESPSWYGLVAAVEDERILISHEKNDDDGTWQPLTDWWITKTSNGGPYVWISKGSQS